MNFGIKASTVRQFLISSGLPSKKAVQIVNQTLNELKVEKPPDKTFIGRIAKGFDFLGYSFEPKGLSIAPKTLANFLDRITQLYEQGADVRRIGQYVSYVTRLFSAQAVYLVFLSLSRALRELHWHVLVVGLKCFRVPF